MITASAGIRVICRWTIHHIMLSSAQFSHCCFVTTVYNVLCRCCIKVYKRYHFKQKHHYITSFAAVNNATWVARYSFVRYCGQRPSLLWTSALRPCSGPVRLPREKRGTGRCVRCGCTTCGEGGLSRSEQLVRYFYNVPPLDVAYCLA